MNGKGIIMVILAGLSMTAIAAEPAPNPAAAPAGAAPAEAVAAASQPALPAPLKLGGVEVVTRTGAAFASDAKALDEADVAILCEVPLKTLGEQASERLRQYVFAGGGLVMTGGQSGFGLGGYYHSAVERALPVYMDPLREPPVFALCVVMDKSWSMGDQIR